MIEPNLITEIIQDPESLKNVTGQELFHMVEKWPWCSTLHMLLLKKLHSTDDPAYEIQLNRSGIRIPDRSILFRLIHNDRFSSAAHAPSRKPDKKPGQPIPVEAPTAQNKDATDSGAAPKPPFEEKEILTEKDSLINEFIQKEPRIYPREGDFAEAVLIAEKSNTPSFDFVTETLANIYLQQGNRKQAIKIFKQLSLTIPEKSSYFAARIKDMNNPDNRL